MVKNLPANAGDLRDAGLIPGSGRSPREGNGNPIQYSCLENPMDRGAWRATLRSVGKNLTQLSMHPALSYKDGVMEKMKGSSFCSSSSFYSSVLAGQDEWGEGGSGH